MPEHPAQQKDDLRPGQNPRGDTGAQVGGCHLLSLAVPVQQEHLAGNPSRPQVDGMDAVNGYFLIRPEDLHWRLSNLMRIPNADFLERTGSQHLGARLWRMPPRSANTLHRHIRAEEFYFVLQGTGRIRVGDTTLTVPQLGGLLVGPHELRQVFNDTDQEVLWLIVGAPEEPELMPGSTHDRSAFYPVDPTQLPPELAGTDWPPKP